MCSFSPNAVLLCCQRERDLNSSANSIKPLLYDDKRFTQTSLKSSAEGNRDHVDSCILAGFKDKLLCLKVPIVLQVM